MIQVYCGDKLIVGVTRGNIDRLTAGQPMVMRIVDYLRIRDVIVLFGEDKPAILEQCEAAGMEIPEVIKEWAVADPL